MAVFLKNPQVKSHHIMKNKYNLTVFSSKLLRLLIVFILVLGIFFRFVNIDRKIYWGDETSTSSRISGYTFEEIRQQFYQNNEVGVEDLQKFQHINPERSLNDIVKSLADEDCQHPPLYYIILYFWVRLFGDSVTSIRGLSVVISLFVFPCIYWLCLELFGVSLTGWMAMGLIAISPLHILYAQEAREYSLWTVAILLSSAALLQAIRFKTKLRWSIYTLTLILALYTHMFSGFVALGHGLYMVISENFKFSKTLKAYLLASLTGIIFFLPWLIIIISNLLKIDETTSSTKIRVPLLFLLKTWILNTSRVFIDFNYNFSYKNLFYYIEIAIIIILVSYSLYFLCRHTQKRTWLFIWALIGVTTLALVIPDLVLGGRRSSFARYLIPCYLGMQIATAYLFTVQISFISMKVWQQKLGQIALVAVVSSGVLSCAVSSQAEVWWNKYNSFYIPKVAQIVNQAERPLLICSDLPPLDLSYLLNSKIRLKPSSVQNVVTQNGEIFRMIAVNSITNGFSDIFVYSRNYTPLGQVPNYQIEKAYTWKWQIDPVFETKIMLWKLAKRK